MDEDELFENIAGQYQTSLNGIAEEVKMLFQEAIQESIYDVSDPIRTGWYQRTNDFENSVDILFDINGGLFVYIDTAKLKYYSVVNYSKTKNNVSDIVPWLLEEGHHNGSLNDLYHNYEGRGYLENAYEKIISAFPGLLMTIINEEPMN
jgi:hypothetical protein